MWVYIARRLLWMPFLLIAVSMVTFALVQFGPGDPVEILMGQNFDPEAIERIRHERGLDKPFFIQYGHHIWAILHGDFGVSFKYTGQPVRRLIAKPLWVSAQLGFAATILSIGFGLPLGVLAALKQGTWIDSAIVSFTLFFMALPVFITAPFLLLVLVLKLHWLPSSGWGGFFSLHIVMPALVLGIPGVAGLTRLMRASTLDILGQDFIRTARSKGLSEFRIQYRHVVRNAMIPIMTVMGFALAGLVTGAFITENIFGIPGIGKLFLDSIFARDYPVIMALTLIVAGAFVLANLFVDIMYTVIDPRIRYR